MFKCLDSKVRLNVQQIKQKKFFLHYCNAANTLT